MDRKAPGAQGLPSDGYSLDVVAQKDRIKKGGKLGGKKVNGTPDVKQLLVLNRLHIYL